MNPHISRSLRTVPANPAEALAVRSITQIRMLRISEVRALTGLSRTKIYELQAAGDFPMRVQLTARCVAWVEADVQAWLNARVTSNTPLVER